jgi:glycosyltransferase involved in cell wall biosynthesis
MSHHLRVLVITKLYPNALEPMLAPFNRQQLGALAALPGVSVTILATVPTFPGARLVGSRSRAAAMTAIPAHERIDGQTIAHPRTLYVPRVHGLNAALYAASLLPRVLGLRGQFDVLLGCWAYPDGAASVLLARALGVPAVVKVHGSDINVVAAMPGPRRVLRALLPRASRVVAVSRALAEQTAALGVARERIDLVWNGVDASLFAPRPRAAALAELGLDPGKRWVLYVGRLEERKGVLDLAAAMAQLPHDICCHVVGDCAMHAELARQPRLTLAGKQPLERIPTYLAAAHALVLPSWAEGTPNVLLEALAAGRRCVATRVGGCADVLDRPELGELVPAREPAALAAAIARVARSDYDPQEIARLGARGGWADSARALLASLERARS